MKRSMPRITRLSLLSAAVALAGFAPHQQIDHENRPTNGCVWAAITLGPGTWSNQPLYVAFEDDSTEGDFPIRSDIMFQKSTDAGRTWLSTDVLVHRGSPFARMPDITTDPDGNIYIIYMNREGAGSADLNHCVRSSDGGASWSAPVSIDSSRGGLARIATDSAGNLFVAWTAGHVYSSVSTDKGVTWSPRVRADDDTVPDACSNADAFVQPGTDHYLVVAVAPRHSGSIITYHCYLYRSTDMGHAFQPGVQLDTFGGGACNPHVVADSQHVICDYTGNHITEARTLYTQPDTWGSPALVSKLDTSQFWSYAQGAKLAISADGSVHTALMIMCDTSYGIYLPYYTNSSDYGVGWSGLELANDDTTANSWNPDIAADSAGHAYVVWQVGSGEVWFSTSNPLAVTELPVQQSAGVRSSPTVVRGVLFLAERPSSSASTSSLLDISGREVMGLKPGANDVNRLSPGVYFVQSEPSAVTKVVVTR